MTREELIIGAYDLKAELLVDCKNVLGEGPIWSETEQRLYWTDIESRILWWFDPSRSQSESLVLRSRAGSIAFRRSGGLLLASENEILGFDPETGVERQVAVVPDMPPETRLNDGRCDRFGRFVVGGFDYRGAGRGSVYVLNSDGTMNTLFTGVNSANSTCFSPDGRIMYFADSPRRLIWAFDYDPERGEISNRRVFHELGHDAGLPDGSAVDSYGCLWNAEWGAGRVVRYTPDGEIDAVIDTPCLNPSCPALGGPDYRTLFITSAREGLSDELLASVPESGGLFSVRVAVAGLPEETFGG